MEPLGIVGCLDVIGNSNSGVPSAWELARVRKCFSFNGGENALSIGIVVAITFGAHTLSDAVYAQPLPGGRGSILASTVRMEDGVRLQPASAGGLAQRTGDQRRIKRLGNLPS